MKDGTHIVQPYPTLDEVYALTTESMFSAIRGSFWLVRLLFSFDGKKNDCHLWGGFLLEILNMWGISYIDRKLGCGLAYNAWWVIILTIWFWERVKLIMCCMQGNTHYSWVVICPHRWLCDELSWPNNFHIQRIDSNSRGKGWTTTECTNRVI